MTCHAISFQAKLGRYASLLYSNIVKKYLSIDLLSIPWLFFDKRKQQFREKSF